MHWRSRNVETILKPIITLRYKICSEMTYHKCWATLKLYGGAYKTSFVFIASSSVCITISPRSLILSLSLSLLALSLPLPLPLPLCLFVSLPKQSRKYWPNLKFYVCAYNASFVFIASYFALSLSLSISLSLYQSISISLSPCIPENERPWSFMVVLQG